MAKRKAKSLGQICCAAYWSNRNAVKTPHVSGDPDNDWSRAAEAVRREVLAAIKADGIKLVFPRPKRRKGAKAR